MMVPPDGWMRGTIRASVIGGSGRRVAAIVRGPFAVHKRLSGPGYVLTHLPTGMAITKLAAASNLYALAERLKHPSWESAELAGPPVEQRTYELAFRLGLSVFDLSGTKGRKAIDSAVDAGSFR